LASTFNRRLLGNMTLSMSDSQQSSSARWRIFQ
jgi:hypothetical protein